MLLQISFLWKSWHQIMCSWAKWTYQACFFPTNLFWDFWSTFCISKSNSSLFFMGRVRVIVNKSLSNLKKSSFWVGDSTDVFKFIMNPNCQVFCHVQNLYCFLSTTYRPDKWWSECWFFVELLLGSFIKIPGAGLRPKHWQKQFVSCNWPYHQKRMYIWCFRWKGT